MSFNPKFRMNQEYFTQRTRNMDIDSEPETKFTPCLANA